MVLLMTLVFISFSLGWNRGGIEIRHWEWKIGLYFQTSLTILGLLAVFIVFNHSWRSERKRDIKYFLSIMDNKDLTKMLMLRFLEKGESLLKLMYGRTSKKSIKSWAPTIDENECAKQIDHLSDEFEKTKPKYYGVISKMFDDAEKQDFMSKLFINQLKQSLVIFMLIAIVSLLLMEPSSPVWSEQNTTGSGQILLMSEPFYLGVLNVLQTIFIYAIIGVAVFLIDFVRSMPKDDALMEAIQELTNEYLVENGINEKCDSDAGKK